jgi:hypothetical protein
VDASPGSDWDRMGDGLRELHEVAPRVDVFLIMVLSPSSMVIPTDAVVSEPIADNDDIPVTDDAMAPDEGISNALRHKRSEIVVGRPV